MFSLGANYTERNHVIICICGLYFPKLRSAVGSLTVGEKPPFGGLCCVNVSNASIARRLLKAVWAAICHHNPS